MQKPGKTSLRSRWKWIDEHRQEVAKAIHRFARILPRQDQRVIKPVQKFFEGQGDYQQAAMNPDILAICHQLTQLDPSQSPTHTALERAVRIGFCSISPSLDSRGRTVKVLMLPLLFMLVIGGLVVMMSEIVLPQLASIFREFEIELPQLTMVVLKSGRLVQLVWPYVVGLGLLGLILATRVNLKSPQARNTSEGWIDWRFKNAKNRAAAWSWHMSMLRDTGFELIESLQISAQSQSNRRIGETIQGWISSTKSGENQSANPTDKEPITVGDGFGKRFRLINRILEVSDPAAQATLFRETAVFYWSHNRTTGDWLASWLITLLFWLFVGTVVSVALAIYLPLFALFRGYGF